LSEQFVCDFNVYSTDVTIIIAFAIVALETFALTTNIVALMTSVVALGAVALTTRKAGASQQPA
jgi:hypothetical protein